jgi:hypothetical protein
MNTGEVLLLVLEIGRLIAGFLLALPFEPEDGGDILLRNIWLSLNYTALQPKRRLYGKCFCQ